MNKKILSFADFSGMNEAEKKEKEAPKKDAGGGEEKAPVEPVDTKDGLYKDMKIDGTPYRAVLSTYDAVANKQEAMGKTEIGIITLPGEESVYELLPGGKEDKEEKSNESIINEEYIEVMNLPELSNALGKISELWKEWKNGPMTEPSDIKPAQKELKGWLDRWFKDNIK